MTSSGNRGSKDVGQWLSAPRFLAARRPAFAEVDREVLSVVAAKCAGTAYADASLRRFLGSLDRNSLRAQVPENGKQACWLPSVFGRIWPGHALLKEPLLEPWAMSEVVATTGIVHFLRQHLRRDGSRDHIEAFVRACRSGDLDLGKYDFAETADIVIQAERVIQGNRRCDVWVEWTAISSRRFILVVEAKVNAPDQVGAFAAYSKEAREIGDPILVYLTPSGRSPNGAPGWIALSWQAMLRQWEEELYRRGMFTVSEDFHRFRRSLWDLTGGTTDG
jgi:hypothetical protein